MGTIKMNKVLIALDYNPTAQKIAEVGFSLAKVMNAEIILLHVFSTPIDYASTAYDPIIGFGGFTKLDMYKPDTELLTKTALDFLENVKKHLGDSKIETLVKEGDYADTILETAHLSRSDIVVIGSHSKKWLEKIVMGSTTEKIVRDTSVPLLIVPTKKKH
jgi:nucleotide-binding universal stress UspA family protein